MLKWFIFNSGKEEQLANIFPILVTCVVSNLLKSKYDRELQFKNKPPIFCTFWVLNFWVFNFVILSQFKNIFSISVTDEVSKSLPKSKASKEQQL